MHSSIDSLHQILFKSVCAICWNWICDGLNRCFHPADLSGIYGSRWGIRSFCGEGLGGTALHHYNIAEHYGLDGYPASLGFPIMHRVHAICTQS